MAGRTCGLSMEKLKLFKSLHLIVLPVQVRWDREDIALESLFISRRESIRIVVLLRSLSLSDQWK